MGTSTPATTEAAPGHPAARRPCEAELCSICAVPLRPPSSNALAHRPHNLERMPRRRGSAAALVRSRGQRRLCRSRVLRWPHALPACAASLTIRWCRPHNPHKWGGSGRVARFAGVGWVDYPPACSHMWVGAGSGWVNPH
jgi:hypothetical protein